MTLKPWDVLDSEIVLDRKWLRVRQDRVRTESGVVIEEFHVIESPPWAATVCVTGDHELVLVEQYRHGHGGVSLELPAGVLEPREDPLLAAQRELLEETGYSAQDWQLFWTIRPEPARHSQWAHFAFARRGERGAAPALDATENVSVVLWPIAELDRALSQMVQAVHVGALLLAQRRGLLD